MTSVTTTSDSWSDHIFWLASRASGVVAIAMLTFTVIVGLALGGRMPFGFKARDLSRIHEYCSLAALVAIAAHGALLLGDPWLAPSLSQLLVPFKLDPHSFYTGLGIVGGWIAVILGLSYYLREKIGITLWKKLHRFSIAAWALSVVHVLGAGTDAGEAWLKMPLLVSSCVVVVLFAMRIGRPVPGAAGSLRARAVPRNI
jgi:predicted ferric reductase